MSIDFQAIKDRHPLPDVVVRYVDLKRAGSNLKGRCPFHDDSDPSLHLFQGGDGLWRWRCFACGAGEQGSDVIDFIMQIEGVDKVEACKRLEGDDLPEIGNRQLPKKPPPNMANEWDPILPVPDYAPEYDPRSTLNSVTGQVKSYLPERQDTYRDAEGRILCHVIRFPARGDGKKIVMVITWCIGPEGRECWAAKRMSPPLPLLGLDLLAKYPNKHVLVVSGEKCWDTARKHLPNFVPVTIMGGDNAVKDADITPLIGRDIVFWPDADPPGRLAMLELANLIEARSQSNVE